MKPIVQISLDLTNLEEALQTAEIAVRAGVDWLEAGTPLLLAEGLHAVRALKHHFPDKPLVADLKTMDAGYLETEMMAKAGADMTVVMGIAHEGTIKGAVRAAHEYGIKVMGDLMLAPNKPALARRLEELGVDYLIHHIGYDERHEEVGKSPLQELQVIVNAVQIPVQAVGGLSLEQIKQLPHYGVPLVVIGAPLVIADQEFKPGAQAAQLEAIIREVCEVVHAFEPL